MLDAVVYYIKNGICTRKIKTKGIYEETYNLRRKSIYYSFIYFVKIIRILKTVRNSYEKLRIGHFDYRSSSSVNR